MRLCESQIDEVTTPIVDYIVVTNYLVTLLLDSHPVRSDRVNVYDIAVADTNKPLSDYIQFVHFHVFKIYFLVVFIFGIEATGLQATTNCIQILLID